MEEKAGAAVEWARGFVLRVENAMVLTAKAGGKPTVYTKESERYAASRGMFAILRETVR